VPTSQIHLVRLVSATGYDHHLGRTRALHVVDLVHRGLATSTKIGVARANLLAWLGSLLVTDACAGGIDRSGRRESGRHLAICDPGLWGPGGVSLVHLPDLAVRGWWLADVSLKSVWVSADGETVYLLENGDQLRVLRTDGSQVAKLALPADTDSFIVPTIP